MAGAVVAALAAGCKGDTPGAGGRGPGGAAAAGPGGGKGPLIVRVTEARMERVDRVVELTGTLGGAEEVTVAAEVEGRIDRIEADLGDRVQEGGVLVRLAPAELRLRAEQAEAEYLQSLARLGVGDEGLDGWRPQQHASVRKAEADLAEARKNLSRGEELRRRELAAEGELDALKTRERVADAAQQAALEEARSAYANARARRAAAALARKKLKDAVILSPVPGLVARRRVALGEYVKAGQAVADVVVADPLKLRGEASERYAGQVEPGMPVRVRVDATGAVRDGQVSRVGPAISSVSRTFPVEALVPNPDASLKPGLFARAEIRVGADEEVVAIPETAVATVAGVSKVFVEEGGKARERIVQLLRKRGSDALVAGELQPGDRVIVTAIARLYEGADVQVDPQAPPDEATAAPDGGPGGGRG